MAGHDTMSDTTKSNASWQIYLKEPLKPSIDQAYQWTELLKPTLQEGVIKLREVSARAKGDMLVAVEWFNSMSTAKQKVLVEMATGAAMMTKEAVAILTTTTVNE